MFWFRKNGLDISLFADLSEAHSDAVISLNCQYRMNSDIMSLTNELVYKNQMKFGSDEVATTKLLLSNYCVHSHDLEKGNYFVDEVVWPIVLAGQILTNK